MTYEEFKAIMLEIEQKASELSEKFSKYPKGEFGLTPDEIKFSPEFRALRVEYNKLAEKQRALNRYGVRVFKKEMKLERELKRKKLLTNNNT